MKIFKFGGASVKDAAGVQNLVKVLKEVGHDNTLLVVSAMGKTTNAMEKVVDCYFDGKNGLDAAIQEVITYHNDILVDLFNTDKHPVFGKVKVLFDEVQGFLAWNKSPNYNFVYDQVVGYGELVSTTILSVYLNEVGVKNSWLDVREFIKTSNNYRDALIDWEKTQARISEGVDKSKFYITQGFLGSDDNNFTTTLGREGSDYTAAIFAYCLNAKSVTIWKDVPGVLNADPRYFEDALLLNQISYREAIELAFYGASVIHPKTLQPLQRKEIPLLVKSFIDPNGNGTIVGKGTTLEPHVPCYIMKKDQVLMRLSSLDFSFIVEDNISALFKMLHDHKMKVSMIQNSAISFSVCIDNKFGRLEELLNLLKARFKVVCHEGVSLYTVRHFNSDALKTLQNGKEVLLEQRANETVQLVVK
ncbi:aspartate kinase [Maribacter polysaccharolyticus]|uniref:aspartate kinase n=1 Tax=Maribacter polysaccharolyticus TaxID=3020831 RepID=UPI00237F9BE2|nr:aspartate kinase [Maribacter polysaccharolyticus]MDE3742450.1 aspartate kinase [Maribacter polysaccharolyticus]